MFKYRSVSWRPDIRIVEPFAKNTKIEGLAVAIDVLRAFSTAVYLFERGLKEIIVAQNFEHARKLKPFFPTSLLMGEQDGEVPADFDLGNSPWQAQFADVKDKQAIFSTTAGTRGLLKALEQGARPVLTGSFVNMSATLRHIRQLKPAIITLVPCGNGGSLQALEDAEYAAHLRDMLLGVERTVELAAWLTKEQCRHDVFCQRFFNLDQPEYPEEDFEQCFQDRVALVAQARTEVLNGVSVTMLRPLVV